jgi:hypothetical protein
MRWGQRSNNRQIPERGIPYTKAAPALVLVSVLLALILASCQSAGDIFRLSPPSSRILFIGNSFTFYNDGVNQQLERLEPSIETKTLATSGYSLKDHWNNGKALETIRDGKWDYVVLQEQSQTPVTGRAAFLEYASMFNKEIKSAGGETVLFMTWERPDSIQFGVTTQDLANAYYDAGARLGAKVAPAGLAFALSLRGKPGLALYVQDGHPTTHGTYLAACVLYATLLGKSPIGIAYAPPSISKEDRIFLQKVAAATTGY